jgi:hypothetical protein
VLPLSGLYGYWEKGSNRKSTLAAVGCFRSDIYVLARYAMSALSVTRDEPWWEPSELPSRLKPTGPVIGARKTRRGPLSPETKVPGDCRVRNWLECTRPLISIRTTLCHSTNLPEIPLVGLTFTYGDDAGGQESIGPDEFPSMSDNTEGVNGHPCCWCSLGFKVDEELAARPHYIHDTWSLNKQRLAALRIWLCPAREGLGSGSSVAAIQLVAEDGAESPKYGHWDHSGDGQEIYEVKFGQWHAAGRVCFVGSNARQVTRDDMVVQAFQALKWSK